MRTSGERIAATWISPMRERRAPAEPPARAPGRRHGMGHGELVRAIAAEKDPQRALDLFNAAGDRPGFAHNSATYGAILRRLAAARRLGAVDALLQQMQLEPCRFEEGAFLPLMSRLSAAGAPEKAAALLHLLPRLLRRRPSPRAVAACLHALALSHRPDLAASVLSHCRRLSGRPPNSCHLNILLKLHSSAGDLPAAAALLASMRRRSAATRVSFSTLMAAHARAGDVRAAFSLFEEMVAVDRLAPDAVAFNALIDGFCRRGEPDKAARVLLFMKAHRCPPSAVNYTTLLTALARAGRLAEARRVLAEIPSPDPAAYTGLVAALCGAGRVDEAVALAEEMAARGSPGDAVTGNAVVGGLVRAGRAADALRWVRSRGGAVSRASYRMVVNGLCREGEVEKAAQVVGEMVGNWGWVPHPGTSNEVLVRLCAAGRAAEAAAALRGLAAAGFAPESATWATLVESACAERKMRRPVETLSRLLAELSV
ncbi:pentatricopeptide repeat-containing protein At5g18475-like [Wolffia australiana]